MIRTDRGVLPRIAVSAYVDPSAQVIGDVAVGERSRIWPNTTVRADVERERICRSAANYVLYRQTYKEEAN